MVFEETLIFYNPEHAEEFAQILNADGCKPVIRVVNKLASETSFKAAIKDFRRYFSDELSKLKECEEIPDEDDSEMNDILIEAYNSLISEFDSITGTINAFYEMTAEDGCISDDPDYEQYNNLISGDDSAGQVRDILAEEGSRLKKTMTALPILELNDLIEEREGKKYLLKAADTEALSLSLPSDVMYEELSEEELVKYNIKTVVSVVSCPEYHLSLPLEFALKADLKSLDEAVLNYDIDKESYLSLKESIFLNTLIAGRVIDVLKEVEKAGMEEMFERLKSINISSDASGDEFLFDLDKNYIKDVLVDMKKMGVIKGKGNRIKLA
ncbi:hypothetical protein F1737_10805 [Methanoplanus sp. FWC-SCC4]|uniref:Uncharacterized protein n=1 Tax=Methanochimaera problematica TaxID=2609417 RepID=A0AA97I566_9EURY|nr:hypothetical protein [Methanoplanus sp. FWC-SCC4]WOF17131.1 hypothetical protein F1737_10805 [Methanoplanus sp. FWC-SCC4]